MKTKAFVTFMVLLLLSGPFVFFAVAQAECGCLSQYCQEGRHVFCYNNCHLLGGVCYEEIIMRWCSGSTCIIELLLHCSFDGSMVYLHCEQPNCSQCLNGGIDPWNPGWPYQMI